MIYDHYKVYILRLSTAFALVLGKNSIILTVILLILLDYVDSNVRWKDGKFIFTREPYTRSYPNEKQRLEYQLYDKWIDMIQYIVAFILLQPLLSPYWRLILAYVLLIRLIGVLLFTHTDDERVLVFFPDIFKECLVLSLFISHNALFYIFLIIIGKVLSVEIPFHIAKK